MKSDRFSYLELIVHHKDFSLYEYPSRFCIIRVPFDKFTDYNGFFELSVGQVRKLIAIGYFSCPHEYVSVGHRPFDRFQIDHTTWPAIFRHSCLSSFEKYDSLFK